MNWYSDGYDKGYQGIIGVVEIPNDDLLIISVQRDSHPELYDPKARKKVGTLELRNRIGKQFIGQFSFDADESLCAVARPFSRDVLGLDPSTLQTRFQCALNGQPIEAMALPDGSVNARDWKSGALLRGQASFPVERRQLVAGGAPNIRKNAYLNQCIRCEW